MVPDVILNQGTAVKLAFLLSCCFAGSHAARVSSATAPGRTTSRQVSGRSLLQAPTEEDCQRSVPFCTACRFQATQGTQTRAACTKCDAGYVQKRRGRACWCAAGYYLNDTSAGTCAPCGENHWCPGAGATLVSGAARNKCGENKGTTGNYATQERACLALPGFGWADPDAVECEVGYYNPGRNNRKCTPCSGDLTTVSTQTTSPAGCVAPEGHYYLRGRADVCARGTYKEEKGNTDCTPCPDGLTTPEGKVAQTSRSACSVLLPGYALNVTGDVDFGATEGQLCPEGTYRIGELPINAGLTLPIDCQPCGDGMSTAPGATGASSPHQCVVLPGYGFAGGSNSTFPGVAAKCPTGKFNAGWNREACAACGLGALTTDGEGSSSPDDCYTPAGHGANVTSDGKVLDAYECPKDTYGRPDKTYGLVEVPCTKCPDNTGTDGTGSLNGSYCLTDPGHGWYPDAVLECEHGYFSPGHSQNPCEYCGYGRNTSTTGSTSPGDCKLDYGFAPDGAGGTKPCLRGQYKDALGTSGCTQCPNGTTTTIMTAATQLSDCDACLPGYGAAAVDLSNPACIICGSGFFSAGYVRGGAPCADCPKPSNYIGAMVSRPGSNTPEYCLPEFPTDSLAGLENHQDWDVIWMPVAANYLEVQPGISTLPLCQSGCSSDDRCQYFEWRNYTGSCYFKLAASKIVNPTVDKLGDDGSFILFEVQAGAYVAYLHNATDSASSVGETVATLTGSSLAAAVAACSVNTSCIGITHDSGGGATYRLFTGTKWEGAVGKMRAVGEALNPWSGSA